jgi:hypothetical protein
MTEYKTMTEPNKQYLGMMTSGRTSRRTEKDINKLKTYREETQN